MQYDDSKIEKSSLSREDFYDKSKIYKIFRFVTQQFYRLIPMSYYLCDLAFDGNYWLMSIKYSRKSEINGYLIFRCENNTFSFECVPVI